MSQKLDGIPQVSTAVVGRLVSTTNLENGVVPIYWGPSQNTAYGYVSPSGFKEGVPLSLFEVVRFFYGDVNYTPSGTSCEVQIVSSEYVNLPEQGASYWYIVYEYVVNGVPGDPVMIGHILSTSATFCAVEAPTLLPGATCEVVTSITQEDLDALEAEWIAQELAIGELTC